MFQRKKRTDNGARRKTFPGSEKRHPDFLQKHSDSGTNTSASSEDPWQKKDEWDARWAKKWGDSPDSIPDMNVDGKQQKNSYPFPIHTAQGLLCAIPFLAGIGFLLFSSIWLVLNAAFYRFFQNRSYWITACILIFAAGIVLLAIGIIGILHYLRFFHYLKKIGQRTSVKLSDLILPERKDPEKTLSDIKKFIRGQYFPEGHLSKDEKTLYLTDEAFEKSE